MPELPEVQTIVSDLNRKIKGQKIVGFWTDWPKLVKLPNPSDFKKKIKGLRIEKVERIGKNIVFFLSNNKALLIHQKMTGHLMVGKWRIHKGKVETTENGPFKERVNKYIHALFSLESGKMIALSDMRKFARIALGEREKILKLKDITQLGPDALDPKLTFGEFSRRIKARHKSIKLTLMDPGVVAGIGNIYADDILWSAKVHPLRKANAIKEKELRAIFKYTRIVLKKAVRLRGTSVGDYRDTAGERGMYGKVLLAYRRTGEPCKRCGTPIRRTRAGQRSAHFCPRCQKL